jgi:hypothetical protein
MRHGLPPRWKLLVGLAASVAVAVLGTVAFASPRKAAAAPNFQLVLSGSCGSGLTRLGTACVDRPAIPEWTIGDGGARWVHRSGGQPLWQTSYRWQIPTAVTPSGANFFMTVEAVDQVGGRICPAMIVEGGFTFQGVQGQLDVGVCAEGRKTASRSRAVTLLSPPNAAPGSRVELKVRTQDGPIYVYTYEAGPAVAKPKPEPKVTVKLQLTKTGSSGNLARVNVGTEVRFAATAAPRLPAGASVVLHLDSGGPTRTRTCAVSPCANGVRRTTEGTVTLWATVVSSTHKVLAKSSTVTIVWEAPTHTCRAPSSVTRTTSGLTTSSISQQPECIFTVKYELDVQDFSGRDINGYGELSGTSVQKLRPAEDQGPFGNYLYLGSPRSEVQIDVTLGIWSHHPLLTERLTLYGVVVRSSNAACPKGEHILFSLEEVGDDPPSKLRVESIGSSCRALLPQPASLRGKLEINLTVRTP